MSRGDYPYPQDEFDHAAKAAGTSAPRGVHRAPRSRWRRLRPFLLVLVLFPLLAYGIVTALSDWDGLPGSGDDTVADGGTSDEPSDGADPSDEPTDGATDGATDEPTAEETTEPEPEPTVPAPVVDLARPVEVFNSTSRTGLAAGAAAAIEAAGFTSVSTGNWDGDDPAASIVYYPAAADVATAQAVAAALGLTAVQESADAAPDGIVVVLADDYVA